MLYHGSLLDVLPTLDADSFTACVTDPPYGLEFMGKEWDAPWRSGAGFSAPGIGDRPTAWPSFTGGEFGGANPTCATCGGRARGKKKCGCEKPDWRVKGAKPDPKNTRHGQMRQFQEWSEGWVKEVYRVLKPGAHLLAFGGTRTYHRICCAIEDAGFEIRDTICWHYGQGFPKSLDISKQLDKMAGADREEIGQSSGPNNSSYSGERYTEKRETRFGTVQDQPTLTAPSTDAAKLWQGYGTALKPATEFIIVARKPLSGTVAANCQEHGCGALNIDGCRVELSGDYKCGANGRPSQTGLGDNYKPESANQHSPVGRWPANVIHDGSEEVLAGFPDAPGQLADISDSAPSKKTSNAYGAMNRVGEASQEKRYSEDGGTNFAMKPGARRLDSGSAARFFYCAKSSKSDRGEGNTHPTVKPLALMSYLVKLVTMPGENRILDPFAGSGTTLLACDNAGIECVGVELEAEHVAIINARRAKNDKSQPLLRKTA